MQPFRDATPTHVTAPLLSILLDCQYHRARHYNDAQQEALHCVNLWWKGSWASGNLVKAWKGEATPERILFHASFGSHSSSFSYGISPSQHYTIHDRACRKVVYPKHPKRKQCSSTSTFARVYLRLRFAAQAVLKARRNGQRKSIISGKVEDLPWRSALQRLDLRQRVPSIRPQKWVCT